jgi:general L-amino acid transport system permease protein
MRLANTEAAGRRTRPAARARPGALWRSLRFRGLLYQFIAVCAVLLLAFYMAGNAGHALSSRGIQTGFGFLSHEAGFSIGETQIPFESTDSFLWAFLAGLANTLWVSVIGLVTATALGTLLAIMRLSSNWLTNRIALIYIEVFRNTPQLMQIVFWYTLMTLLPGARQAWRVSDWLFLSNRGLVLAWPADHAVFLGVVITFFIALLLNVFWTRWADAWRQRTGKTLHSFWISLFLVLGAPTVFWAVAGAPSEIDFPSLAGFNFRGGATLSPEFLALTLGLTL